MSKEAITNTEVTDEQTLLQVVLNGHLDCMDSLISAGVDVNATDDNGDTALITRSSVRLGAVRKGIVAKVMFLQVCVCPQGGRVSASVHAGMPSDKGPVSV